MSKHTPGPWVWDDDGATLRGPRNMKVLQDGEGLWNLWNSATLKDGMGEANARLIAVAPMMYEYIASSASNGCAEAKKLIAKAEGKL
jgi:hypothetical protein